MMEQFQAAFEEFKKTNDANVGAKADGAEVTEALQDQRHAVDAGSGAERSALKAAAASMNGNRPAPSDPEYSGAFASFMRAGNRDDEQKLTAEQRKAACRHVGRRAS